jgi:hypothetical protein
VVSDELHGALQHQTFRHCQQVNVIGDDDKSMDLKFAGVAIPKQDFAEVAAMRCGWEM